MKRTQEVSDGAAQLRPWSQEEITVFRHVATISLACCVQRGEVTGGHSRFHSGDTHTRCQQRQDRQEISYSAVETKLAPQLTISFAFS